MVCLELRRAVVSRCRIVHEPHELTARRLDLSHRGRALGRPHRPLNSTGIGHVLDTDSRWVYRTGEGEGVSGPATEFLLGSLPGPLPARFTVEIAFDTLITLIEIAGTIQLMASRGNFPLAASEYNIPIDTIV